MSAKSTGWFASTHWWTNRGFEIDEPDKTIFFMAMLWLNPLKPQKTDIIISADCWGKLPLSTSENFIAKLGCKNANLKTRIVLAFGQYLQTPILVSYRSQWTSTPSPFRFSERFNANHNKCFHLFSWLWKQ